MRSARSYRLVSKVRLNFGLRGCAVLVVLFGTMQPIFAQEALLSSGPGQLRTLEDMNAFNQAVTAGTPVSFHPTVSDAEYAAMKSAAATLGGTKPDSIRPLTTPIVVGTDFDGIDRIGAQGTYPPDTHGAIGVGQYVQVTNFHITGYDTIGNLLIDVSLNAFFGSNEFIFDPRVVYDTIWNRWVIMCTRSSTSAADANRHWFIAFSQTADVTGGFWVYSFGFGGGPFLNGDWWDFPGLGMDQDAILVTGNIFPFSGGCRFSAATSFAKARVYNGLGFGVPIFTPGCNTIQPPIVLDQNGNTFLISAPPNSNTITKYTMTNTSRPGFTTFVASGIPVAAYSVPPNARQPGTAATLDTADSRFESNSIQNGDFLWNVHTTAFGSFPAPTYFQFNTANNTVVQTGTYFASGTSDDFNASIAANANGDLFTTWSATDTPAGIQAQMMFSGRCHSDPPLSGSTGSAVAVSGTFSAQLDRGRYRWGDYSATVVDPTNGNVAWIVNEWTPSNDQIWGSHISQIGFLPACP